MTTSPRLAIGANGCVVYKVAYCISFFLIFVGSWIYRIDAYGFLFGVGLGWLPSMIAAALISLFWPLIVADLVYFFKHF